MKIELNFMAMTLAFLLLTGMKCKKDEMGIDALPSATQQGKNTFGCLVNGEVFLPKGSSFGGPVLQCYYQFINNGSMQGYYFQLSARKDGKKECELSSLKISTDNLPLKEGIYQLETIGKGKLEGAYTYYPNCAIFSRYKTNSVNSGELRITNFNEVTQIVSGTFWFDAVNEKGEKVEVREGRFDMQFSK